MEHRPLRLGIRRGNCRTGAVRRGQRLAIASRVKTLAPGFVIWRSNLIVFVSSACTMVLELVAGRIMAPYIGVSLYTWTSIIGVVLAGISLGNYLGGKVADRFPAERTLGVLFFISSMATLGV